MGGIIIVLKHLILPRLNIHKTHIQLRCVLNDTCECLQGLSYLQAFVSITDYDVLENRRHRCSTVVRLFSYLESASPLIIEDKQYQVS